MTRARDNASQGGLVLINKTDFSASSSTSINNVFTSTYDKYKMILDVTTSVVGRTDISFRFRVNGSDDTQSLYGIASHYVRDNGGTGSNYTSGGQGYWPLVVSEHNNGYAFAEFTFLKPSTTLATKRFYGLISQPMSGIVGSQSGYAGGAYFGSTAFDGFTIYPNQGNMTGTISVYGYRK